MQAAISHALSLLLRSLFRSLDAFGGTVAVGLGLAYLLVALILDFKRGGWAAVVRDWWKDTRRGVAITLIVWFGVFIWSIPAEIYRDHNVLATALASARSDTATALKNSTAAIDAVKRELATAKTECAAKDGANVVLERQNKDQQATINSCLSQAMKLLTPAEQRTTMHTLKLDKEQKRWEIIALTNKPVEHPKIRLGCNRKLPKAGMYILDSGMISNGGMRKLSESNWEIDISSPAWSTTDVLYIDLTYEGSETGIFCRVDLL